MAQDKDDALPKMFGGRIRHHRKRKGFSLAQLSEISGVSVSMISKIEKGQSMPPISTYANLGRGLGISLSEVVAEDNHQDISLVRADDREVISNGVYDAYSLANHFKGKKFAPYLMLLPAGKDFHKPFVHTDIQEMLYILEGSIEFSFDGEKMILAPGDCVCFNGNIPHTSRTIGEADCRILAIQISE